MYPIIRLITFSADAVSAPEQLGTKDKFWYAGREFLFKQVRPGTGEDWSEKVCAELAQRLGLPHAEYDLAQWISRSGSAWGVRSRNFCPPGADLVLGNELLAEADPEYNIATVSKFRVSAHTVGRVISCLHQRAVALPLAWRPPPFVDSAVDTFIGYLLLDALAGNTDRHHENWGVLRLRNGVEHLAPAFDQASSLGRNLLDAERDERLRTKDRNRTIEAFAARAASSLYRAETDRKPLSPMDTFSEAARFTTAAALGWLDILDGLTEVEAAMIIRDVPSERMSDTAARFAIRLICVNRINLLALRKALQ
jgi:hypothetical protein